MNASETYSWHLWKRRVNEPGVRFYHRSDMPSVGFASVYAVDEATADNLQSTQAIQGFRGIVFTEKLWIDCDTEEASRAVETGLRANEIGFEKYATGNRGAHYGIERSAKPSQLLPLQDKAWVKARFPESDMRLYTHLHLFRVVGNPHEKTGKKKELVETVAGSPIVFEGMPAIEEALETKTSALPEVGSIFDDRKIMEWSTPQTDGRRHEVMLWIALRFAERGESASFAMRWLEHVNMLYGDPKPRSEIERIVSWAYEAKR